MNEKSTIISEKVNERRGRDLNPRGPEGHPLSRRAPWSDLGHPGNHLRGTNLLDLVAPFPGFPCLTILLVIANSPR